MSAAIVKYIKSSSGKSQFIFADLAYPNGSANWAQITVGHDEDGKGYFTTGLPSLFSGGLSVSGGEFSLLGSGVVDGTWTVNGNVKCYTINGTMLNVASSGGAHIVRQITGYTKGQVPSETYYSGHILYGSGATNQTGNRLAGNEIAISPLGNITYTFSCYEPVAGSTKTTSIRLGYSAGADSWINLSSDSINLAGRINANGYLYLNQGATVSNGEFSVENGGITCAKNIVAKGTQAFRLEDSVLDALTAPDTNIQRWPLGVYDKNGNALGYIKYNKSTDGKQSIQLLSRYLNSDGSYNLVGISVGHKPDGTFYSDIPHPVTDSHFSPPNFAVFSSTKVGQALALGTSASVLTCSKKPCRSREIAIHASTVSTTLEVIAPKPHQISSDVQVIASLIGARHATADNVSKAHFGCFERRLMICQERSGH